MQQVHILHRSPAAFRGAAVFRRSFQALVLCLGQAPAVVSPQLSGPTGIPKQYVNCLSLVLHESGLVEILVSVLPTSCFVRRCFAAQVADPRLPAFCHSDCEGRGKGDTATSLLRERQQPNQASSNTTKLPKRQKPNKKARIAYVEDCL